MPMFSKRHYDVIAQAIYQAVRKPSCCGELVALNLAELFEDDNPNFDRQRFEIASGLRETISGEKQ